MAFSYSLDAQGYFKGDYSSRKISEDKILVSSFHGGWAILTNEEFRLLQYGSVDSDPQLHNLLLQEGIILSEDNLPFVARQCRHHQGQLFCATGLHILTPTLRCNQKCAYCYASSKDADSKGYDMDEKTAKAIVDFILQSPSNRMAIEFQGGEPLLNMPIIKYVVEYARSRASVLKKDIRFRLVTNLTCMDEEKLEWLLKNNVDINSSLDGPEKVHNANRIYASGKGSYQDVAYWLKKLCDRGIRVSLMPTITRKSLPFYKEIIDEYLLRGQNRIWLRRMNRSGFALESWEKIGYGSEEYLNFWKKSLDYIFELNRKGTKISEGYVEIMLRNIIFSKNASSFVCLASPCGCAWSQISYNHRGDIYACDEARSFDLFKLGNVHDATYEGIFSDWKALDIVDLTSGNSFDCAECAYHPFCGPCIVDEYGEHGDIIKRPDSYNCRIKKGMFDYIFKNILLDEERLKVAMSWLSLEKTSPGTDRC